MSRENRPLKMLADLSTEANAEVMKCEGNRHVPAIEAIVSAGIPVQGHIGIT